ncbi:MAG: hypothetical protein OXG85_10350 [Chloroflexi bacterium]|nr:hypothetical protein [Chloroflexota bacterium]
MTAQDDLRRAIERMQEGQVATAVEMLNGLVTESELDDKGRAAAYVWLAESRQDVAFKIRCLERALRHDPDNRQIRQGLEQLKESRPPPGKLPGLEFGRGHFELQEAPPVVGILGGMNGLASGVFINRAGLIATTSYALGGAASVMAVLSAEQQVAGAILRRFPAHDLALIETPIKLARPLAIAPSSLVGDGTAFVALGYGGAKLRGALQPIRGGRAKQWLRTTIPPAHAPDAGGNPLYDEDNQLLALLTRNVDSAGNALAIKISHIVALAKSEQRRRQLMPNAGYCRNCGARTRAQHFGGIHCEGCGAALDIDSAGSSSPLQSDKLAALYSEDAGHPCAHCGARVSQYAGRCLRCGRQVASAVTAGS